MAAWCGRRRDQGNVLELRQLTFMSGEEVLIQNKPGPQINNAEEMPETQAEGTAQCSFDYTLVPPSAIHAILSHQYPWYKSMGLMVKCYI